MVTDAVKFIGKADCIVCGEEIPVRENGRGTLNLSCPWCGVSAYVKPGSQAHRIAQGWVRAAPATPAPAAPAPAAPAPKAKKAGFSLEDL